MGYKAERDATARARELGGQLRAARERVGLTGTELAKLLGWSPSKISRMESGNRGVSEVDVAMYLAYCRVHRDDLHRLLNLARDTDERYRMQAHGKRLPDELRSLIFQENQASAITAFEPQLVPGLLQTEEYIRELFAWAALMPAEDIDVFIRARLARQELLRRQQPPRMLFYVHERALRTLVGSPLVMHEQVLHLLLTCSRPQCVLRVIPEAVGPCGVLGGAFRFLRYPEHSPLVYVESYTASLFLEEREDIAAYRAILTRIDSLALDEGQSREWLARLASRYECEDREDTGS